MFISVYVVFEGWHHYSVFIKELARMSSDFSHNFHNIVTDKTIDIFNDLLLEVGEEYIETRFFVRPKTIDELTKVLNMLDWDDIKSHLRSADVHVYKECQNFVD